MLGLGVGGEEAHRVARAQAVDAEAADLCRVGRAAGAADAKVVPGVSRTTAARHEPKRRKASSAMNWPMMPAICASFIDRCAFASFSKEGGGAFGAEARARAAAAGVGAGAEV